ncbi:DUF1090 domain-containing protein [Pseudomonas sp. NPDC077186]|uniref:DUF1090 domain-containing protein n=1 Tax=Pseudomonas sp. NPDC077186 TaxID=3364421 RepID=UPI0037C8E3AD
MIRQLSLLALLVASTAFSFADSGVGGCAAKRQALQEKIEIARQHDNRSQLAGLQQALAQVEAHCRDGALQAKRLDEVNAARQEIEQREMDLRDALSKGDPDKIAKRQAKLAEARAELEQAEAELAR